MRALLALGRAGQRGWTPTAHVARSAEVPLPFLHRIVGKLARAGLVETRAGPGGGLRLGTEMRLITLLRVFEAVDGPLAISPCLALPASCSRSRGCAGRRALAGVQDSLRQELGRITLARMLTLGQARRRGAPRLRERHGR